MSRATKAKFGLPRTPRASTQDKTMLKERVHRDIEMLDLASCEGLELQTDGTGKAWVNLDGKCIIRVGHAKVVTVEMKECIVGGGP